MHAVLVPHSTNQDLALLKVVLTRAQTSKGHTPFKIDFMHLTKFIVM